MHYFLRSLLGLLFRCNDHILFFPSAKLAQTRHVSCTAGACCLGTPFHLSASVYKEIVSVLCACVRLLSAHRRRVHYKRRKTSDLPTCDKISVQTLVIVHTIAHCGINILLHVDRARERSTHTDRQTDRSRDRQTAALAVSELILRLVCVNTYTYLLHCLYLTCGCTYVNAHTCVPTYSSNRRQTRTETASRECIDHARL